MANGGADAGVNEALLRVANASGFLGDQPHAWRTMLAGGPLDVITGDYLAELTMLILAKARRRDASAGYATTFLSHMEESMGLALDAGVRVVVNAGGLNPAGLAERLHELAARLGLNPAIAWIEGDDLLDRLSALVPASDGRATGGGGPPLTANAYLGGHGIAMALQAGADIVVCPRVTDASLVVGPAVWRFGWRLDEWDRLAAAVVAGHVIECGPQATGGNFSFFDELADPLEPGFPIAELHDDGTVVITKHPGTGGAVTVETVIAQLLYEVGTPAYVNPDVVARFDSIQLEQEANDRVRITGARGRPPPEQLKVATTRNGGFRNGMTMVITGLDVAAKATLALAGLERALGGTGRFDVFESRLDRLDKPDPATNEEAAAFLHITVKDADQDKVGRDFSNAVVGLFLASYPGFLLASPPGGASAFGVYEPAFVDRRLVDHVVILPDGTRRAVPWPPSGPPETVAPDVVGTGTRIDDATRVEPLGRVFGARSGDKGGDANVGLWARGPLGARWLDEQLTATNMASMFPDLGRHRIERYRFPNLRAVNFVVHGLLGEGVASSTRFDPQAKGLGEYVRARLVPLPLDVIAEADAVRALSRSGADPGCAGPRSSGSSRD